MQIEPCAYTFALGVTRQKIFYFKEFDVCGEKFSKANINRHFVPQNIKIVSSFGATRVFLRPKRRRVRFIRGIARDSNLATIKSASRFPSDLSPRVHAKLLAIRVLPTRTHRGRKIEKTVMWLVGHTSAVYTRSLINDGEKKGR